MFCKNCGSKLKDDSTFCHNCGSPVNDYVVNNPQVTPIPENTPVFPQVPTQNAPTAQNYQQPMQMGYMVYPAPQIQQPTITVPAAPMQNVQNTPEAPYGYNAPVNPPIYQNAPNVQPNVPPQYNYVPYPVQEPPKKSGGAFPILSLIFGIIGMSIDWLGIFFSPVALIFGIISRKKSKSGMSIAGIILGSIGIVTSIIALISLIYYAINGENPLNSFTFFDDGLYF